MTYPKCRHFVPKTYLNSVCDKWGRVLVYRKGRADQPLRQAPEATQFCRDYYSPPTPAGVRDHALEQLFSTVETEWPQTVALRHARKNVNDGLEHLFHFLSLQRFRVPSSRDAIEAVMAQSVKDTDDSKRMRHACSYARLASFERFGCTLGCAISHGLDTSTLGGNLPTHHLSIHALVGTGVACIGMQTCSLPCRCNPTSPTSASFAGAVDTVCTKPESASTPMCAFIPKCH